MTTTKKRPRVGDRLWCVEWCDKLAFYEDSTDVDRDRCTMKERNFPTREEARRFAEEIWPKTTETFGIVELYEMEFTAYDEDDIATMPHVGFWEVASEPEIFSGEWE
jgi:hypothetical protein